MVLWFPMEAKVVRDVAFSLARWGPVAGKRVN